MATGQSVRVRTLDYIIKYEDCARQYETDPVEFLFRVLSGHDKSHHWDASHKIDAAKHLIKYRFPQVKALEITDAGDADNQNEMAFTWRQPGKLAEHAD